MNYIATLCAILPITEVEPLYGPHPQCVKGPSGTIYKACWSPHNLPNSGTHTNISVQALEEIAPQLPSLGKSVAISGITDPQAFMDAFGLIRCDQNGNELTTGEEL
jgi:hypothetical protein